LNAVTYPHSSQPAPADTPRFQPGQLLAGRYRIVAVLGRGGMGEVYRADDLALGQAVALKFLPPEVRRDAERLPRFRQEIRIARQMSHPNVCRAEQGAADVPMNASAPSRLDFRVETLRFDPCFVDR
jgi:serine/threonine protein kinase